MLALVSVAGLPTPAAAGDFLTKQLRYPRVRAAKKAWLADAKADFLDAGAAWPPKGVMLRAFKSEGVIELWSAPRGDVEGPWVKIRDFEICAASGVIGPKVRQGDLQVPEGFYHVNRFNPASSYHLSLGLNYPNAVDKARSGRRPPGGDIFIHGSCVTIGCMPLEDGPVSYLYIAAVYSRDAGQRRIPVHVFPCRMGDVTCRALLKAEAVERPDLEAHWATLAEGYEAFERGRVPPRVRALKAGRYRISPRAAR